MAHQSLSETASCRDRYFFCGWRFTTLIAGLNVLAGIIAMSRSTSPDPAACVLLGALAVTAPVAARAAGQDLLQRELGSDPSLAWRVTWRLLCFTVSMLPTYIGAAALL